MRLLTYTRYLWRKIKLYDKIAFKTNPYVNNPFQKEFDKTLTIIWVNDEDDKT